jgi:hypothetical protein
MNDTIEKKQFEQTKRTQDFFLVMDGHKERHRQLALKRFFDRNKKDAANDVR